MPISKRLYPHDVSSQLGLRPNRPYDPENEDLNLSWVIGETSADEEVQVLDLTRTDTPWTTLRFELEATLPASELQRIVPTVESIAHDTSLVVSMVCTDTRLRRAVVLEFDGESWHGEVNIRRDDLRGTVRLTPRLVRTNDLPDLAALAGRLATGASYVIAEGRSLDLRIDLGATSSEGALAVKWEDFTNSTNSWRRSHSDDIYFLELDDRTPTLFLNAAYAEFKAALSGRARKGGTAVIRHLGNAFIAHAVWLQLYDAALSTVESDEEEGVLELPRDGWKKAAIDDLLSRAFPGYDRDEQIKRLQLVRGNETSRMTTLSSAAQQAARGGFVIKQAVRAAETFQSEGE